MLFCFYPDAGLGVWAKPLDIDNETRRAVRGMTAVMEGRTQPWLAQSEAILRPTKATHLMF